MKLHDFIKEASFPPTASMAAIQGGVHDKKKTLSCIGKCGNNAAPKSNYCKKCWDKLVTKNPHKKLLP
jgi:hypothetical protein